LKAYFSFTLIAFAGQFDWHSKHAAQLIGFATIGRPSNHSRTLKAQDSTHFLQPVHLS